MANTKGSGVAFILILILYLYAFSQIYKGELSSQTGLAGVAFGFIVALIGAAVVAAKT